MQPVYKPNTHVIYHDPGGVLSKYEARWRVIAAQNEPVEIMGMCQSACTLVTGYVRKKNLCFGERGYLSFHMARLLSDDSPSPSSTQPPVEIAM